MDGGVAFSAYQDQDHEVWIRLNPSWAARPPFSKFLITSFGMDTVPIGFPVFFLLAGLLCAGLAVPMILRKVKPNSWYGFRIPQTLADETIWYDANAYAGKLLLGWAAVDAAASILLYLAPAIRQNLSAYATAIAVIDLGGLALILTLAILHVRRLTR
jgi:hypothetical protein